MRRPSKNHPPKLSIDSQRLCALAQAMAQASSRIEERAWERQLDTLIRRMLKTDHQHAIDAALDHLYVQGADAYDALMDGIESAASGTVIEHEGQRYDALLVAVPILAWTRFAIASGTIAPDTLGALSAQLYAHILADGTRMALAPTLYSIDQLPRSHAQTFALTQRMAQAALTGTAPKPPIKQQETAPFLADTRYLLAVVVTPADGLVFRWQSAEMPADIPALQRDALDQLEPQIRPSIERLLPGCGIEILLPQAYFVACREGDKRIRPVSVHAAVHYLTHILQAEPKDLVAIVGGFGDELQRDIEEYRISFTERRKKEVIYGIVWPLYGEEDADEEFDAALRAGTPAEPEAPPAPLDAINAILRESGITEIIQHDERFPMEFCDDCGSPLFCDAEAELVHPEMPEDAEQASGHLH
jgi:hypothetical protein